MLYRRHIDDPTGPDMPGDVPYVFAERLPRMNHDIQR